jgi:cysteinyl-tRNA synthetase
VQLKKLEDRKHPPVFVCRSSFLPPIQQRTDARKRKNFEMSDRIRNELQSKGITLIDKAGGVTDWHRN